MKFRKKPVVIEATQWFVGGPSVYGVVWVDPNPANDPNLAQAHGHYAVHTLEGPMRVSSGDWIITGVKGEKYSCKPDIFAATYDPVE